jgi:hypothetical protein
MRPMGLNLQKINSFDYILTPIRRAKKIMAAITSNKWINCPPSLREYPPSQETINTTIIISNKLTLPHPLSD